VTADLTPTPASSSSRHPFGTVYLLHFDQRYEHAGHYTGWAEDLDRRLAEHLGGRGARLIEVIVQAGIGLRLARTWPGVTRARERQLKRQGGASRYCPICQAERKARGLPRRLPRDQRANSLSSSRNGDHPGRQWRPAVPTRGTRPERVAAFLELNPMFALPAGASQAKQWGRARGREQLELLTPRVTAAVFEENQQPSQHRVATITRRAVRARLAARQHQAAARAEQARTRQLAARTHQRLTSRQQPVTRQQPATRPAAGRRPHRTREERDHER
jgi:predicted GIY-YIG superfamily endonuclease